MKYLLSLLLICLCIRQVTAQYAIVNDKDGFVYVRQTASVNGRVNDTLHNGDIVWCYEADGNWMSVDYMSDKEHYGGYIYSDRLAVIRKTYEAIPVKELKDNMAVFEKDSIRVVFTAARFDTARDKPGYHYSEGVRLFSKVNGQDAYGTDGYVPKQKYAAISVKMGAMEMKLPASAIENMLEPNLESTYCYTDRKHNTLYLIATNSDGAGSYVVLWVVKNGRLLKRVANIPF